MEAKPRHIEKYINLAGKVPFDDWFHSLRDYTGQSKVAVALDRLEDGNLGRCRALGQGVNELKINFGPGYRIYFGESGNVLVILLCGGDKGTQSKDILKAKEYWMDYKRRSKHEK